MPFANPLPTPRFARFTRSALALLLTLPTLTGCMSLTGLAGETEFSCPRADGLPCADVETTYRLSREGLLPQQLAEAARLAGEAERAQAGERQSAEPRPSTTSQDAGTLKTIDGVVRIGSSEDTENTQDASAAVTDSRAAASAASAVGAQPTTPREAYEAAFAKESGFAPRTADPSAMLPGLEYFASPKRVPEKLIRLWIAPYADDEGDLHDAHAVYIRIEDARWATAARRKPEGPALVPLPFGSGARSAASSASSDSFIEAKPLSTTTNGEALRQAREAMAQVLETRAKDAAND